MAVYRVFPSKDSFIYTQKVDNNAGMDEMLEIAGYPYEGIGRTSRTLIEFDSTEITNIIDTYIGANNFTGSFSASINMYLAEATELPVDFKIYAYPVYQQWDNGTGKFGDLPVNNQGVTWGTTKVGASVSWLTSSYPTNVTASFIANYTGGGTWYTGSNEINLEASQSYTLNADKDLAINVTPAVKLHYSSSKGISGGITNNGFILKLEDQYEFNTTSSIKLKYFSVDTHTIYPPYMDLKWDDYSFSTGSSSQTVITDTNPVVSLINSKEKYTDEGKVRFRIKAKPKYPVRTFVTSSNYLTNYYLPQASYWAIKDEHTEEMVIDFDTAFTRISADSQSSYFDVYMNGIQPERYYRLLVKTEIDGSTIVLDDNVIFKVVRNA